MPPALTPGPDPFLLADDERSIVRISLSDSRRDVLFSRDRPCLGYLESSPDGSLLLASTTTDILVWDITHARPAALLQAPPGCSITSAQVSPRNTWVAARAQMNTTGYHAGLIVWNLGDILNSPP
jgi:hypothetical protein